MTSENKEIARRVHTGESPAKLAKETGKTRGRIYQIFHEYCQYYLFHYEYEDACESKRPMNKLKYYLTHLFV